MYDDAFQKRRKKNWRKKGLGTLNCKTIFFLKIDAVKSAVGVLGLVTKNHKAIKILNYILCMILKLYLDFFFSMPSVFFFILTKINFNRVPGIYSNIYILKIAYAAKCLFTLLTLPCYFLWKLIYMWSF